MDLAQMRTHPIHEPSIRDVFDQYRIQKSTPLEIPPPPPTSEMEPVPLLTGIGSLLRPDYFYEGEFVEGIAHGKGKCVYSKVQFFLNLPYNEYEGDFVDEQKHGQGTIRFLDGTVLRNIRFVRDFPEGNVSWEDPKTNIRYQANANGNTFVVGQCILTDGTTHEGTIIVLENRITFISRTRGYRQNDIRINRETIQFVP